MMECRHVAFYAFIILQAYLRKYVYYYYFRLEEEHRQQDWTGKHTQKYFRPNPPHATPLNLI